MADEYDVIIVGSGAGGGTLTHRLAPSGKRVLILERGDWLPREIENWDATAVFVDNRYVSKDTWYDENGKAFQPQIHYFVGGATKFYGLRCTGCASRTSASSPTTAGSLPRGRSATTSSSPTTRRPSSSIRSRARGEDPTDPPAGAPYPFPPVSHEPRIQQLFDDMARVGMHPFHAPCGIMLDEANPALSTCIRCATCDGFPCLVHAKSDADVIAVRPSLGYDNVTLVRNATVQRLETEPSGRTVTSVVADVDGAEQRYTGSVVVVSAGAANSAKLLLASANDKHPNGLANGSDQVGRNYVFHNSRAFLAVSMEKNDTRFQKTLGMNDYYFGDDDFGYPMGNVQMVGKSSAPMYRGEKPIETKLAPTLALDEVAERAVDFWLSTEDLPAPDNRVTLNNDGNIVLTYTPNNREPLEQLYHRVTKHLSHLGMHPHHLIPRDIYMKNDIPVAGCAHQAGTVRFGTDRATSVLDIELQGARAGQPLCRRHQLFPEHRGGEPGAHRDGQRPAGRRSPVSRLG